MAGCPATCGHYQLVSDYWAERARQFAAAVEESGGYSEELAARLPDLVNFRIWLEGNRRGHSSS